MKFVRLIKAVYILYIFFFFFFLLYIDVAESGGGQSLKVNKYSTLDAVSNYEVILWNKDGEMLSKLYVDSLCEAKTLIINYLKNQKQ